MDNELSHRRKWLRKTLLAQRDALPVEDRQRCSARIVETLLRHPQYLAVRRILLYCSFRSEVQTAQLMRCSILAGKEVCVPLTVPADHRLVPIGITDPQRDLIPGYQGIPEPTPAVKERDQMNPATIELVVLPGAVFDRTGNRLGYGGGYYDRFLTQEASLALRIGLAFSLQVVERLPKEAHDVPLDFLITERETFSWRR